jgi:hypothetical protein
MLAQAGKQRFRLIGRQAIDIQTQALETNQVPEQCRMLGIDFLYPDMQRQRQKSQRVIPHDASCDTSLDCDGPTDRSTIGGRLRTLAFESGISFS